MRCLGRRRDGARGGVDRPDRAAGARCPYVVDPRARLAGADHRLDGLHRRCAAACPRRSHRPARPAADHVRRRPAAGRPSSRSTRSFRADLPRAPGGSAVRVSVMGGPAAWRGPDMAKRSDWKIELTAQQQTELLEALVPASRTSLRTMTTADFPLPTLGAVFDDVKRELIDGRGFVLVRGVPID